MTPTHYLITTPLIDIVEGCYLRIYTHSTEQFSIRNKLMNLSIIIRRQQPKNYSCAETRGALSRIEAIKIKDY